MTSSIQCTCIEVRHKQRGYGRMTLRGAVGAAGRVRYKCHNPRCGRTKIVEAPNRTQAMNDID